MPRLFLVNWVCTMPSILNLITVLALNTEYTNARAEMKNGMYSPIAYIIATTLVQVPMMGVLGLCALIPGFAVGNWPWEGFGYLLIIYAANMWCFETMAQLFSLGSNVSVLAASRPPGHPPGHPPGSSPSLAAASCLC